MDDGAWLSLYSLMSTIERDTLLTLPVSSHPWPGDGTGTKTRCPRAQAISLALPLH
jgi:hypothetical protein